MRMRIMNNEKKIQDAEKEAGGDEKLIFKFAWPYPSISQLPWHKMYVLKTAQKAVCETNLSISERSIMYTTIHLLLIYIKVHFKKVGGGGILY